MIRIKEFRVAVLVVVGAVLLSACGSGDTKTAAEPEVVQTEMVSSVDQEITSALVSLAASVKLLEQRVDELEGEVGSSASMFDPLSDQIEVLDGRLADAENCISRIRQWTSNPNFYFSC